MLVGVMTPSDATPSNPPMAPAPVTLFYSYAHEDEALRDELQDHLAILERRRVIRSWHDRAIVPGHDWSQEIDRHLGTADLVLLLISKDFIASDYIMGVEIGLAMARQQRGESTVVPILLRPVDLQPEDAQDMPFVALLEPQGLPRDLKPVTTWANRDEAWTQVASGLRATVNEIRARRRASGPAPAAMPAPSMAPMPAPRSTRGPFEWSSTKRAPVAPVEAPAPRPLAPEIAPAIDRVVADVVHRVEQATVARGEPAPDVGALRSQARRLIDTPDPPRLLWVDDQPDNNRAETAMLARLQIEVEPARSTAEALARLDAAARSGRPFDLVISDWTRKADGPLAGLRLIGAMRNDGHPQPVVVYHGSTGDLPRAALAAAARAAGALGEATLPAELLALVLQAPPLRGA